MTYHEVHKMFPGNWWLTIFRSNYVEHTLRSSTMSEAIYFVEREEYSSFTLNDVSGTTYNASLKDVKIFYKKYFKLGNFK